MKLYTALVYAFLSMVLSHPCSGQQSPLYSQYMFNGLIINPAYAGSHEAMSVSALYRKQWTRLDGGPSTQMLSAHTPLNNKKIALGLLFYNDQAAVVQQTGVDAMYAYRISFSDTRKLSLGLQLGYNRMSSDYSSLQVKDPNDPSFSSSASVLHFLYYGAGAFYSSKRFYAGLSAPHAARSILNRDFSMAQSSDSRNYFLTAGYVLPLSQAFRLKPSVLLRSTDQLSVQADINCTLLYEEVFWIGVSYRTFSAVSFVAQVQLTNQLSLGYAFDNALGEMSTISGSAHEFLLTYNFAFFRSNTVTPRDF